MHVLNTMLYKSSLIYQLQRGLNYYTGSTFKYTAHNDSRNGKNAPTQVLLHKSTNVGTEFKVIFRCESSDRFSKQVQSLAACQPKEHAK